MLLVSSDFQFNILGQFRVHVRLCMFFFENEEDVGVKVEHVDCSDAFNTFEVFV